MEAGKDVLILQKSLQFIPFRSAYELEVVNRDIPRMLSQCNDRNPFQQFGLQGGMLRVVFTLFFYMTDSEPPYNKKRYQTNGNY
jgi:hypothetical protein